MIKAFITATISADGFIARLQSEPADWMSTEAKANREELTKRARIMILGSRTFDSTGTALPQRKMIVYSHYKKAHDKVLFTKEDPKALLASLAYQGYSEVAICGGASIFTLFMENYLVDKIYLTVESVIFGQGISLFTKPMQQNLLLLSQKPLSPNTVLLEYKVER